MWKNCRIPAHSTVPWVNDENILHTYHEQTSCQFPVNVHNHSPGVRPFQAENRLNPGKRPAGKGIRSLRRCPAQRPRLGRRRRRFRRAGDRRRSPHRHFRCRASERGEPHSASADRALARNGAGWPIRGMGWRHTGKGQPNHAGAMHRWMDFPRAGNPQAWRQPNRWSGRRTNLPVDSGNLPSSQGNPRSRCPEAG